MIKLRSIGLMVVASSLFGCALTTERIDLQYQPTVTQKIAGASAISVNVQVSDQRQEKTKVSSKKNGFGMEMAPIITNEEPAITIRRAIDLELTARGFKTSEISTVTLVCDLTRFYNDHKVGFFAGDAVAELNMLVMVRGKDGRQLFSRSLIAQGVEPNTQLMSGNNARLALNQALTNGMKMLFEDQAFLASLLSSASPLASVQ